MFWVTCKATKDGHEIVRSLAIDTRDGIEAGLAAKVIIAYCDGVNRQDIRITRMRRVG